MAHLIVFTDLDGTLLDAQTYAYEVAYPALQRLQAADIPIIFCSAKTHAEQSPLRAALNVKHPYIVENGSAIIGTPDDVVLADGDLHEDGTQRVVLGVEAARIHQLLDDVHTETGLNFQGFADLTTGQVADITGLRLKAAKRAQMRDYSETVITQFSPEDFQKFQRACGVRGLKTPNGGKFITLTGRMADKGNAIRLLTARYRHLIDDQIITIGIGDSPNDAPMLACVDYAFLVQRPDATWRDVQVPKLRRLAAIGPNGFVQMVDEMLNRKY